MLTSGKAGDITCQGEEVAEATRRHQHEPHSRHSGKDEDAVMPRRRRRECPVSRKIRIVTALFLAVLMLGTMAVPAFACGDGGGEPPCPPPPCSCECRTPGFWKNHPDAWPVSSITIGGVTYTKSAAIEILEMPVSGDKTYTLFKALVAARLNQLSGCTGASSTIGAAQAWMCAHPLGSGVKGEAWASGECLYLILDAWNNNMD